MTTSLILTELSKFLESPEPQVICLRGKWGVGKTHAWRARVAAAQSAGSLALARYSYVSLFGIGSLTELKFAIFEYSQPIELKSTQPLNALDASLSKRVPWRKILTHARKLPKVGDYFSSDAVSFASFLTIRNQIVCFDDIERRGKNLELSDILGLVSFLREERNCKVALVLNDEKLDEESRKAFDQHLEKVVDKSLVYRPTPSESAAIAISGSDRISRVISERCISLGISNIRVIRRAMNFAKAIEPCVADFDEDVLKSAISSITLFSWSHDQPDEAPPLSFLKKTNEFSRFTNQKDVPTREAAWNALLDAYGYTDTDELDLVLMDGVCDGYFDPERVKKAALISNEKVLANKADGSFESAWRLYHDSFQDDAEQVLDNLHKSFMQNYKYISPVNVSGTVSLFKDLGRGNQAKEMLDYYIKNRKEDRKYFDLAESPFGDHVTDPDVRAAFDARAAQLVEQRDILSIILSIKDGWDDERLATLAALPVEEYRKLLKEHMGAKLRQILANLLQFDRIANASESMKEISRRTREALRLIGQESPINARRVSRYGIKIQLATTVAPQSDQNG